MLHHSNLDIQLKRDGYVLLDAHIEREVQQLESYILHNFELPASGFYYSLLNNDFHKNKELSVFINNTLHSFYENNFTVYRILSESFLVKLAENKEEMYLHQDWNYTDETKFNAYNIWIPLTDVSEQNGSLFFIPGSHLWFKNFRSGSLPSARISYTNFPKEKIQKVELKKGQVVLFHPAVFHGSFPNNFIENRIVVTATVLPTEAPFLYYNLNKEKSEIDLYNLTDDTFLKDLQTLAIGGSPDAPIINYIKDFPEKIAKEDIEKFLY